MLSRVGDLGGESVDEIQRIEDLVHEAGARIGWGAHAQASAFGPLDDIQGEGTASQISGEALGALNVLGRHGLLAVHGESRVDPAEQRAEELLPEPLLPS